MNRHKFAVGQKLRFTPEARATLYRVGKKVIADGVATVVKLEGDNGRGEPLYQIRLCNAAKVNVVESRLEEA